MRKRSTARCAASKRASAARRWPSRRRPAATARRPSDVPRCTFYRRSGMPTRGNPEADATLARIDAPMLGPVVEAMVAHEVGHCWRYVNGAWHTLPAGFVDSAEAPPSSDPELTRLQRDMRETRREEGFADLVG